MIKSNPDTVVLKAKNDEHEEGLAGGVITPGDLLAFDSIDTSNANDNDVYVRNAADGVKLPLLVAEEDQLGGVGDGMDDDYAADDSVTLRELQKGDVFQGHVFDGANAGGAGTDLSANANISAGDKLVAYGGSGEAGTFRAFDGDNEGAKLVEARESVDNSGGSTKARIKLKVI